MKILAISQARGGSKRLPGKIFMQVNGKSLLEIHLSRALLSNKISKLILATTLENSDDLTALIAEQLNIPCYRGNTDNVLDRYYQAAKKENCDYVVRITADCPLIDPELIDKVISEAVSGNYDYTSNTLHPTYPDGVDVEVFKFTTLQTAWKEATLPQDLEHVTSYIWKNSSYFDQNKFTAHSVENKINYSELRITVDEQNDFELITKLIGDLGTARNWQDYVIHLLGKPEYLKLNNHFKRSKA